MWFALALIAMTCFGLQNFLLKVAGERKYDSKITVFSFFFVGAILAIIIFLASPLEVTNLPFLVGIAIIQVTFFLTASLLKLESMKHTASLRAFPIFGTHGAITALLAITLLGEVISIQGIIGIFFSLFAILILMEGEKVGKGTLMAVGAAAALAISNFFIKIASGNVVPLLFIAVSYTYATVPSYLLTQQKGKPKNKKGAIKIGAAIGVLNLTAFYLSMIALETGPASIIFPIIALSLLLAIVLSEVVYKEKITITRVIAIALAVLSLVLLRTA